MNFHRRIYRSATDVLTAALAFALGGCGGGTNNVDPSMPSRALATAARSSFSAQSFARGVPESDMILYSFGKPPDGGLPFGGLMDIGGTLYGTTNGGGTNHQGTVYSVTTGGKETVLYRFSGDSDGGKPIGAIVDIGGTLYGTTVEGGGSNYCIPDGCGTVFEIAASGEKRVLYSFPSSAGGIIPEAGLIDFDGTLYGTTDGGGVGGTVFKITTSGEFTTLYAFKGPPGDGAAPAESGLVAVGGILYGTTLFGGTNNDGTVYKLTTSGKETVLYSFKGGLDGSNPQASLINVDGALYGTTRFGGQTGKGNCDNTCGTVFKITTTGVESVIYRFTGGSDGGHPWSSLLNVGGTLYGTTANGGGNRCKSRVLRTIGCGTVFKVTTSGAELVLHRFSDSPNDGANPQTGLTEIGSTLYGTTFTGGAMGRGTVFSIPI